MKIHTLEQQQALPITLEEAWEFFSAPANLEEITPEDVGFEITSPLARKMFEGQIITYRVKLAPAVRISWVTEIKCVVEGRSFVDEQRFGPYKLLVRAPRANIATHATRKRSSMRIRHSG